MYFVATWLDLKRFWNPPMDTESFAQQNGPWLMRPPVPRLHSPPPWLLERPPGLVSVSLGPPRPKSRLCAAPIGSPDALGLSCAVCTITGHRRSAVLRCLWCAYGVCEACYWRVCQACSPSPVRPAYMCDYCWKMHDLKHRAEAWPSLAPAQGNAHSAAAELEPISVTATALGIYVSNGRFDQARDSRDVAVSGDSSPAE